MKKLALVLLFFLLIFSLYSQSSLKPKLYFLPGQGSDNRLFSQLKVQGYESLFMVLPTPLKNERMPEYAKRLLVQIDTTEPFILIGVSFGGMCAVELAKISPPQKLILISSAKTMSELPFRYRMQRIIPLYKMFGGKMLKRLTHVIRPFVEPDYKQQKPIFKEMLENKDPHYMERTVHCIIHWKNQEIPSNTIHIHGTKDHTLPFRKINGCIAVNGGSHMMTLTKASEINQLLNELLK